MNIANAVAKLIKNYLYSMKNVLFTLFFRKIQQIFINIFCFKLGKVYICIDNTIM